MAQYLLDTSVVVDFLRGDDLVVAKITENIQFGLAISTVSLAELYHGVQKSQRPRFNKNAIDEFIDVPRVTVIPVDQEIAVEYGRLMHTLEQKGVKLAVVDTLIAVTAKVSDLTVLTGDQQHFPRLKKFGVKVEVIGENAR